MTALPAGPNRGDLVRTFRNFHSSTGFIAICMLVFAVGFNLVLLYPEVAVESIGGNDRVMHLLFSETTVQAITRGQDFTDPWLGTMGMGIPAFHHYQHLPHVSVALVHVGTLGVFPLADMLRWTTYLLLSLFLLSIYWSLRRFGFDQLTAAMGGLVASLIVTPGIFGFGYISYVWRGHGLYSQLWAMLLMPPAIAIGYRVLREGRGYFWATLLLAATLMSHVLYVYMAFLTLGILTFIRPIPFKLPWNTSHRSETRAERRRTGPNARPADSIGRSRRSPMAEMPESTSPISTAKALVEDIWRRWRRLVILLLLVSAVTSYFLVPLFLDRQYLNRSVWHTSTMYDSHGHSAVLLGLIEGNIFDFDRFPSSTILVFVGFVICFLRWRKERYLIPVAIFSLWLLLYFGRATWGPLIDLLPMSRQLHMHRFIAGVHLGGICLMAIALAAPWRWAVARKNLWYVAGALALTSLVLLPVYIEGKSYLTLNADTMQECQKLEDARDNGLTALFEKLRQLPPGRIYAGVPTRDEERWTDEYSVGCTSVLARLYTEGLDMVGRIYQSLVLNQ